MTGWVELREVVQIDSVVRLRHLSERICHQLEVRFLVFVALSVSLLDRLSELSAESVEALNVCFDNLEVIKDLVLAKVFRVDLTSLS